MKKITLLSAFFLLALTTYAQDNLIYEQEDNNPGVDGVISDYFNAESKGTYSADDFKLTEETAMDSLTVYGFSASDAYVQNGFLVSVHFHIYADANGEPAGDPSDEGTGEFEMNVSVDDPALNITKTAPDQEGDATNYAFTVDVPQAMEADQVTLPAGTYWIVAFAELSTDVSGANPNAPQWNWWTSTNTFGNGPKLTDPENLNGVGPGWSDINEILGSQDYNALAFSVYGDEELGVEDFDQSSFTHYTKNNKLFLTSDSQIDEVSIYNMLGQEVANEELNDTSGDINIAELSRGVYITRVSVNGKSKSFKFSK